MSSILKAPFGPALKKVSLIVLPGFNLRFHRILVSSFKIVILYNFAYSPLN
jgi:hypothetical protein